MFMHKLLTENNIEPYIVGRKKGELVFFDTLNRLYTQLPWYVNRNYESDKEKYTKEISVDMHHWNLEILFDDIILCLNHGLLPHFVFDGKTPEYKKEIVEKRKSEKKINTEINDTIIDKTSDEYKETYVKGYNFTKKQIDEIKAMLKLFGLKFTQSLGEADPQCAVLADFYKNHSIGVVTNDTDILMYGSPNIIKNFMYKNTKTLFSHEINLQATLKNLLVKANNIRKKKSLQPINSFTHEDFIHFNILTGSEYSVKNKMLKFDNINCETMFEIFAVNDFSLDSIGDYFLTKGLIESKDYFLMMIAENKKYFLNVETISPNDIKIVPDEVKRQELIDFMCKRGFSKRYIEMQLDSIAVGYYAMKKITELMNDEKSSYTLKGYQFKHYSEYYTNVIKSNNITKSNDNKKQLKFRDNFNLNNMQISKNTNVYKNRIFPDFCFFRN